MLTKVIRNDCFRFDEITTVQGLTVWKFRNLSPDRSHHHQATPIAATLRQLYRYNRMILLKSAKFLLRLDYSLLQRHFTTR